MVVYEFIWFIWFFVLCVVFVVVYECLLFHFGFECGRLCIMGLCCV